MKALARHIAVLALAATPALGESGEETAEEGFSLLEQGARILLRSMLSEMEPALKDLQQELDQALTEMEPVLRGLAGMIGDIRNYHAPEMLPNGDIILRRKTPAEQAAPAPGEETET